jgi:hypothetical protein
VRIHALAAGRVLHDVIPDGQNFRMRFTDGLELVCAWGSAGPELKDVQHEIFTAERDLHPQFRYVTGKTVRAVLTDGQKLLIEFTDGHTLRSSFRGAPVVDGIDVKFVLPAPCESISAAGSLR